MITRLGRRFVELGVLLFAGLGFLHVKLGKRTGAEHVLAILETKPAREAASELRGTLSSFRARILNSAIPEDSRAKAKEGRRERRRSLSKMAPLSSEQGAPDASAPWPSPYGA